MSYLKSSSQLRKNQKLPRLTRQEELRRQILQEQAEQQAQQGNTVSPSKGAGTRSSIVTEETKQTRLTTSEDASSSESKQGNDNQPRTQLTRSPVHAHAPRVVASRFRFDEDNQQETKAELSSSGVDDRVEGWQEHVNLDASPSIQTIRVPKPCEITRVISQDLAGSEEQMWSIYCSLLQTTKNAAQGQYAPSALAAMPDASSEVVCDREIRRQLHMASDLLLNAQNIVEDSISRYTREAIRRALQDETKSPTGERQSETICVPRRLVAAYFDRVVKPCVFGLLRPASLLVTLLVSISAPEFSSQRHNIGAYLHLSALEPNTHFVAAFHRLIPVAFAINPEFQSLLTEQPDSVSTELNPVCVYPSSYTEAAAFVWMSLMHLFRFFKQDTISELSQLSSKPGYRPFPTAYWSWLPADNLRVLSTFLEDMIRRDMLLPILTIVHSLTHPTRSAASIQAFHNAFNSDFSASHPGALGLGLDQLLYAFAKPTLVLAELSQTDGAKKKCTVKQLVSAFFDDSSDSLAAFQAEPVISSVKALGVDLDASIVALHTEPAPSGTGSNACSLRSASAFLLEFFQCMHTIQGMAAERKGSEESSTGSDNHKSSGMTLLSSTDLHYFRLVIRTLVTFFQYFATFSPPTQPETTTQAGGHSRRGSAAMDVLQSQQRVLPQLTEAFLARLTLETTPSIVSALETFAEAATAELDSLSAAASPLPALSDILAFVCKLVALLGERRTKAWRTLFPSHNLKDTPDHASQLVLPQVERKLFATIQRLLVSSSMEQGVPSAVAEAIGKLLPVTIRLTTFGLTQSQLRLGADGNISSKSASLTNTGLLLQPQSPALQSATPGGISLSSFHHASARHRALLCISTILTSNRRLLSVAMSVPSTEIRLGPDPQGRLNKIKTAVADLVGSHGVSRPGVLRELFLQESSSKPSASAAAVLAQITHVLQSLDPNSHMWVEQVLPLLDSALAKVESRAPGLNSSQLDYESQGLAHLLKPTQLVMQSLAALSRGGEVLRLFAQVLLACVTVQRGALSATVPGKNKSDMGSVTKVTPAADTLATFLHWFLDAPGLQRILVTSCTNSVASATSLMVLRAIRRLPSLLACGYRVQYPQLSASGGSMFTTLISPVNTSNAEEGKVVSPQTMGSILATVVKFLKLGAPFTGILLGDYSSVPLLADLDALEDSSASSAFQPRSLPSVLLQLLRMRLPDTPHEETSLCIYHVLNFLESVSAPFALVSAQSGQADGQEPQDEGAPAISANTAFETILKTYPAMLELYMIHIPRMCPRWIHLPQVYSLAVTCIAQVPTTLFSALLSVRRTRIAKDASQLNIWTRPRWCDAILGTVLDACASSRVCNGAELSGVIKLLGSVGQLLITLIADRHALMLQRRQRDQLTEACVDQKEQLALSRTEASLEDTFDHIEDGRQLEGRPQAQVVVSSVLKTLREVSKNRWSGHDNKTQQSDSVTVVPYQLSGMTDEQILLIMILERLVSALVAVASRLPASEGAPVTSLLSSLMTISWQNQGPDEKSLQSTSSIDNATPLLGFRSLQDLLHVSSGPGHPASSVVVAIGSRTAQSLADLAYHHLIGRPRLRPSSITSATSQVPNSAGRPVRTPCGLPLKVALTTIKVCMLPTLLGQPKIGPQLIRALGDALYWLPAPFQDPQFSVSDRRELTQVWGQGLGALVSPLQAEKVQPKLYWNTFYAIGTAVQSPGLGSILAMFSNSEEDAVGAGTVLELLCEADVAELKSRVQSGIRSILTTVVRTLESAASTTEFNLKVVTSALVLVGHCTNPLVYCVCHEERCLERVAAALNGLITNLPAVEASVRSKNVDLKLFNGFRDSLQHSRSVVGGLVRS